ncbi:MAG: hypothetical protein ACLFQK_09585 [Fibrobacterota bacterium]
MKRFIMIFCLTSFFFSGVFSENWPGFEGLYHQSSSAKDIDLAGGNYSVKWDTRLPTKWTFDGYNSTGAFFSRNLTFYYGYLALVASTDDNAAASEHGAKDCHVTVLKASDGTPAHCIYTNQWWGTKWAGADALETAQGEQVVHWDPETGVLHLIVGGDHCSHRSYRVLDNIDDFDPSTGNAVKGIYAWQHMQQYDFIDSRGTFDGSPVIRSIVDALDGNPPLHYDEWDCGTIGENSHAANRSSYMDVQPGSPYLITTNSSGHNRASGTNIANKYTGRCANIVASDGNVQSNLVKDMQIAGLSDGTPVWKRYGAMLVKNDCIYYMGPWDPAGTDQLTVSGLRLVGLRYENSDNQSNDGYSGPGAAETANPVEAVFDYKFEAPATSTWQPFIESDTYNENKAWFVQGEGVWCAWKPAENSNFQLVRALPSGVQTFDLSTGADLKRQSNVSPYKHNIAYSSSGSGYVAYFVFPTDHAETNQSKWTLTSFDIGVGQEKWSYDLGQHFSSLPVVKAAGAFDHIRLAVAGKFAVISWIDNSQDYSTLKAVSIDLTAASAPSSRPAVFEYRLDASSTSSVSSSAYPQTRLSDIIAVDGKLYALVYEDDQYSETRFQRAGYVEAQRVIALGPDNETVIEGDISVSPDSGAGRLVCVCDASKTSAAGSEITSYEWDFSYDHLTFNVEASGIKKSAVFSGSGEYTVACRITTSDGTEKIAIEQVTVSESGAATRSAEFSALTNTAYGINSSYYPKKRVSGSYGAALGTDATSEHSRGYCSFQPVSLNSSYELQEARLNFTVSRINNAGVCTVHRLTSSETPPTDWAGISSLRGYDQDGNATSPISPLDQKLIDSEGSIYFDVTDAVKAWLGRGDYSAAESQKGFLLCIDDSNGEIVSGDFYSGETDNFQWDWSSTTLELLYTDPDASAAESLSDINPGASSGESCDVASGLNIFWAAEGSFSTVDIYYSTASSSGPWTLIASGEENNGEYEWQHPVSAATMWIKIEKYGDPGIAAVSAYSFSTTGASSIQKFIPGGNKNNKDKLGFTAGPVPQPEGWPYIDFYFTADGLVEYEMTVYSALGKKTASLPKKVSAGYGSRKIHAARINLSEEGFIKGPYFAVLKVTDPKKNVTEYGEIRILIGSIDY